GNSLIWTSDIDGNFGNGTSVSTTQLSVANHTITLTARDSLGVTGTATITISVNPAAAPLPPNTPPNATITAPANQSSFLNGTQINFTGTGIDAEDGALSGASLAWTSSIDGNFGTGDSINITNLSIGNHTITLTATDSQTATGTDSILVEVYALYIPPPPANNTLPNVTINSPANYSSAQNGTSINFIGSAIDAEDGILLNNSLVWTSNYDGNFANGTSFLYSGLSIGYHTITLTATDSNNGSSSASIILNITAPPPAPPAPTCTDNVWNGDESDTDCGGSCPGCSAFPISYSCWNSSDCAFSTCDTSGALRPFPINNNTGQPYTIPEIRLLAGQTWIIPYQGRCTIIFPPLNNPPTAFIIAPSNHSSHYNGTSITFGGTGQDVEDGTLSGASLVWTSSIDGNFGTGTIFSYSNLSIGTHTITLTATDSMTFTGSQSIIINITLPPNILPNATISSPPNNSSFINQTQINFTGLGIDAEDGNITQTNSLVWTSSLDGNFGNGTSVNISSLSVGTHTINLTVTDSRNGTGSDLITITVLPSPNTPPIANITAPANNSTFVNQTQVNFTGYGTDAQDGMITQANQLVWTSNLDGNLGNGTSVNISTLSVGLHNITLTAIDSGNMSNATMILINISRTPNAGPLANITAPANNSAFMNQTQINFTGHGIDAEDGMITQANQLVWTSSIDGNFGNGTSINITSLTVGLHNITLNVTDSEGMSATTAVTINITKQNDPPFIVNITAPPTGSFFYNGTQINFTGFANDTDDGLLSGNSLVWQSSLDGNFGNGTSVNISTLSSGIHNITLTAIDSGNLTASYMIIISINQTPVFSTIINSTVFGTFYTYIVTANISGIYGSYIYYSNVSVNGTEINWSNVSYSNIINSYFINGTSTNSTINNSILTRCTVNNALVKGYTASDCLINNSVADPPVPSNFIENSSISAGSSVNYSDVRDSTVIQSVILLSDFFSSYANNSGINNSHVNNSMIINSWIMDATVDNTIIDNNSIIWMGEAYNSVVNNQSYVLFDGYIDNTTMDVAAVVNSTAYNSRLQNYTIIGPDSYVDGIFADNTNITDSDAYDSNFTLSYVDFDSYIDESDISNSWILDADIYNSIITNSIVYNQSEVDQSFVNGSLIMMSNVWDNSVVDNSTLYLCNISNNTIINSFVMNTTISDAVILDALILEYYIISGTITIGGMTYNATQNGPANFTDFVNIGPTASIQSITGLTAGSATTFVTNSQDPNVNSALNDNLTYTWHFGTGTNVTTNSTTYNGIVYSAPGTYNVTLVVTDAFGAQSSTIQTITISQAPAGGGGGSTTVIDYGGTRRSGGGGGGGSSSLSGARIYEIDLSKGPVSRFATINNTFIFYYKTEKHTILVKEVDNTYVKVEVHSESWPTEAVMQKDETAYFELDGDYIYDLAITPTEIRYRNSRLKMELIEKPVPANLISQLDRARSTEKDSALTEEIVRETELRKKQLAEQAEQGETEAAEKEAAEADAEKEGKGLSTLFILGIIFLVIILLGVFVYIFPSQSLETAVITKKATKKIVLKPVKYSLRILLKKVLIDLCKWNPYG
ncbi:PKD domain-containing protein, partial [Candidatus Woesearchaeota archaeon]|nr:PKD domain-containing protein [Candidatus Woesearchaeota archaeon]